MAEMVSPNLEEGDTVHVLINLRDGASGECGRSPILIPEDFSIVMAPSFAVLLSTVHKYSLLHCTPSKAIHGKSSESHSYLTWRLLKGRTAVSSAEPPQVLNSNKKGRKDYQGLSILPFFGVQTSTFYTLKCICGCASSS